MSIAASTSELRETLRAALQADPAVTALVENRILTSHGRDTEQATREYPVLIIEFRGGESWASSPVQRRSVRLYGYSNVSAGHSEQIYNAARAVLQNQGRKSGKADSGGDPCPSVCVYGTEQNGPFDGWSPDVAAWFTFGTFRVWGVG